MDLFDDDQEDSDAEEENSTEEKVVFEAASRVYTGVRRIRKEEEIAIEELPEVRRSQLDASMLELFPKELAPVYVSPGLVLKHDLFDIGGGRGMVAGHDLDAGELLLVERPIVRSRGESPEKLVESLADRAEHEAAIESLLHILFGGPDPAGAFQRNAFASGLFAIRSMFNDAGTHCNCLQLVVPDSGLAEVWSFQPVRAGQPLTISYLQPMDSCTEEARAHYLLSHHDVDILHFAQLSPAQALVDNELETLDSPGAALHAVSAAFALLEEESPDTHCLRRRALRTLLNYGTIAFSNIQEEKRLFLRLQNTAPSQSNQLLSRYFHLSSTLRSDIITTLLALAWLDAVQKAHGPFHPDTGLAAAYAADALDRATLRSPAILLAELTGLIEIESTAANAALLIRSFSKALHKRAERSRALFDVSRWLSSPS